MQNPTLQGIFVSMVAGILLSLLAFGWPLPVRFSQVPEFFPAPPADHSLIYVIDEPHKLSALPFENAETPIKADQVAKSTSISYIELKGQHSSTVLKADQRIFIFTMERPGMHPPFIVLLTLKRGNRRATAISQRGLTGFAISSDQIVKPSVLGLWKNGDEVFMQLSPRVSLAPGEYAIIGADLTRVATFRVEGN